MDINTLIALGKSKQASDIHIEEGLPICLRVSGRLIQLEDILYSSNIMELSKSLVGRKNWSEFIERGSWDLSKVVAKTRCRISVFKTARGLGLAIRILLSRPISIKNLNLHPDLMNITDIPHGLVLFSGATGSGKSTSMAALIEEINAKQAKHIITIEQPVEYFFRPKKSLVRQREVGRDTPSFAQALKDALREDPDVIVVGEMRDLETMRLTLNAAETGHLVFATVHSATVAEAIARMISSFGPNEQDCARSQLADSIVAVVCQRIVYHADLGLRIPECEILYTNESVRSVIRNGTFSKIKDLIMTGASDCMWTFERYKKWILQKNDWIRFDAFKDYEPDDAQPSSLEPIKSASNYIDKEKVARASYHHLTSQSDLVIDEDDDDLDSILNDLK